MPGRHTIDSDAIAGSRLPALSSGARGGVPGTGTPSGKFLRDDDTWAVPAGSLDISGLTEETTVSAGDFVPVYDASAAANRKMSMAEIRAYMAEHVCLLRLNYNSATQLLLSPFSGDHIEINGKIVSFSTGVTCASTANRITSTGADAGAALSSNTLYYAYVSNADASYAASSLRLSTVAPTGLYSGYGLTTALAANIYDDFYLGGSGNALNWRFVGLVRTNASGQFSDSLTERFVRSYYNRKPFALFSSPGYNNNNAQNTWTSTSGTFAAFNAGTGSDVGFVCFPDDVIHGSVAAYSYNTGSTNYHIIGIALDGSTDIRAQGGFQTTNADQITAHYAFSGLSPGYHYLRAVQRVTGGTGTFIADDGRGGATADVPATYIAASCG